MPYTDPEKQKAAKAKWYREKRAKDAKFRKAEKKRVAKWKEENRDDLLPKMRAFTKKWRGSSQRKCLKG
jgi:hypothetical protein